MQTTAANIW